MTRADFLIKWGVYSLALLVVCLLELYVLSAFPIGGIIPMLLPQAAIALAVLEGPVGGAGFGLGVGLLFDAVHGGLGGMTLGLAVLGMTVGVVARYVLQQNLISCLICAAGSLFFIAGTRVLLFAARGIGTLPTLLRVAGLELFWSLLLTIPVYFIFLWVYRRAPKRTVL